MKKLLSILLAFSIMATPLVSRVSFAEEILPQEAEKEQSWFQKVLNETKKAGTAGWLSAKEFANIAFKGAAWLYELAATNPEFSIVTALQVLIIFTIVHAKNKFFSQINKAAKNLNKNSKRFMSIVNMLSKMAEDPQNMIKAQESQKESFGNIMEVLQQMAEDPRNMIKAQESQKESFGNIMDVLQQVAESAPNIIKAQESQKESFGKIMDMLQQVAESTPNIIKAQESQKEFFGKIMDMLQQVQKSSEKIITSLWSQKESLGGESTDRLQEALEKVTQIIGDQCERMNEKEDLLGQTMTFLSGLIQGQSDADLVDD